MPRRLREMVVILGGIREVPMSGATIAKRTATRRTRRVDGEEAMIHRSNRQLVRLYPREWRRAHRLIKAWSERLRALCYHTPLGRLALHEREPELVVIKEGFAADAADHNNENPHWQVLDELSWCLLDERSRSDLLTVMGGDMPAEYWEDAS